MTISIELVYTHVLALMYVCRYGNDGKSIFERYTYPLATTVHMYK